MNIRIPSAMLLAFAATGCGSAPDLSTLTYDSATTVALDAAIPGILISTATSHDEQMIEIKQQLMYMQGELANVPKAIPQLGSDLRINITGSQPRGDGTLLITYFANTKVAWLRPTEGGATPQTYTTTLPTRGDSASLSAFALTYGPSCGGQTDPTFWYYYNPTMPTCILHVDQLPVDATRVTLYLSLSAINTENKLPDYDKLWDDGKLVVTYVGGIASVSGGTQPGVNLLDLLERKYGPPTTARAEELHSTYKVTTAQYMTASGPLYVNAVDILVPTIEAAETELTPQLQALSSASDFVSYNGHSGFGANIRAFERMTLFIPGKYYFYWLNACHPFAYMDATIFSHAQTANSADPWSKHLDLMAAVGVGDFAYGLDVKKIIEFLVAKTATFREISARFNEGQAAVVGEEDNPSR